MRAASPLDRPLARIVALLCFTACAGVLAYMHRDDLFPPKVAVNDPLVACISTQSAQIDAMLRDNLIAESQAALFRQRGEARCIATHGGQ